MSAKCVVHMFWWVTFFPVLNIALYNDCSSTCREDYHGKKAEERKQFKAESKAKAKQWVQNQCHIVVKQYIFYFKWLTLSPPKMFRDKEQQQNNAEEKEMVSCFSVLMSIALGWGLVSVIIILHLCYRVYLWMNRLVACWSFQESLKMFQERTSMNCSLCMERLSGLILQEGPKRWGSSLTQVSH